MAEKLKNPEFKKAYENEKVIADKKVAKATKKQSHAMAVPSETAIGLHKIELIDNVTLFNSANPTAGEILLEEFLKPMGITQAQLAKATFISQKRLREFIAGKRAFDADIGLRLSRYFSMSDGFFERLQLEHDLSEARGEIAETLSKIKPLRYKKHDVTLEKLAGTWSEQDAAEFQENIEALENITSVSREGYCFNPNSQIGPIQFDAEGAKALFELMENPPEPSPALKKVIAGVNKRHKAGRRLKEQEKRRFFELADRLGASTDTKEQQELKEQLARMTFGADDPIVQEVRKAGEELAKKSNYSLRDMFKRLRNNEKKSKVTKGTKKV
ncbi:MAG: HigA family addiction module antitoxin [Dissulfurispiraceae bacterium]